MFEGEEAVDVYEKIGGFNQRVQQEILRQSEGDFNRVESLVAEAKQGVFDLRRCGGTYACEVVKEIAQGRLDQAAFENLVAATVEQLGAAALEEQVRKSARDFWKTLALS